MEEIFEKLNGMRQSGFNFGTDRTRTVLDRLNSPDKKLKIIHIAGTNGKGSTAEYLTDILIAAGKKTGTFTSPEVYSYFEQFRINAKPVPADVLADCFSRAFNAASNLGATPFEIETAGALTAFAESGCEYAVIECGLGGLTDATNAIAKKEVAVITSISLEHTAYLGGTIEKICEQKAGIIKNCPAVVSSLQPVEAEEYFKKLGAVKAPPCAYKLKMQGSAQPYNAGAAATAAEILGIDAKFIKSGIENTVLSGRLEVIKTDKTYILDGAHNPQSFENLKSFLEKYDRAKNTVIFGCLSDKDAGRCLDAIRDCADRIIAVTPDSYRAMDGDKIFSLCKNYFKNATRADGICSALEQTESETVTVCGSFTLLKEAKDWILK
ncbi:MAG: hypothetical protein K2J83_02215 [Clostridia bacterium]|nr:hypothetical protein [Clostridia bacterium]